MKTNDVPLISVIVPVFNIEDYIERCLNSLQAQTMKDIEIIVIDDGSTDNSGKICDRFAEQDHRFKVIHKNNEGLSAARNDGLDISKGKYIMFVDGDDWVEPEFCEAPYNVAEETDAEIVIFEWAYRKTITTQGVNVPAKREISKKELFTRQRESIAVVAWNKIYKRNLFEGVCYPVGRVCEDRAITHLLIYKAKSIFFLNAVLYYYYGTRPKSITTERSCQFQVDEAHFYFLRQYDLFRWGYIGTESVADAAIFYLVRLGRKADLSAKCDEIIRKNNYLTNDLISPKRRIMIFIYRISSLLFDLVCNASGRRINNLN